MTVWQIYKSRFLPTQAFILVAGVVIYLYRRDLLLAGASFVFLQFAAVYGSWKGKQMLDHLQK